MINAAAAKITLETPAPAIPEVRILGSRIHLISVNHAVDQMESWIAAGGRRCRRIVVTGFHGLWNAHQDAALRDILNGAELWVPDGIAPVWIARLRGLRHVQRSPGAEIMQEFLRRANQRGYSSYLYGDCETTLSALRARIETDYPGHRIAGVFAPPFRPLTPEEDEAAIQRINASKPDVLWVALGMPKQDLWIYQRLARLRVPVAIGVGAAFAFVAGRVERCPRLVGRLGFEWVYRLYKEPRKLWRRDLIDGPRFVLSVTLELLGLRRWSAPRP